MTPPHRDRRETTAPQRRVKPRPGRLRRWLRHTGIVLCFVVLYLVAFEGILVVSVLAIAAYQEWSRPALCSGLPEDPAAAAHAFDERIYGRFPVGTPWRELQAVLQDQGFKPVLPQAGRLNPGGRHVALSLDRSIWCEVRWTSDASGRVTSVRPLLLVVPR